MGKKAGKDAISRRGFVAAMGIAAAAPVLGCSGSGGGATPTPVPTPDPSRPPRAGDADTLDLTPPQAAVIAATWSWGRTVCERAALELSRGRAILDAIEAGIREVELDPSVTTVGYGGMPNEAGVVQLDAMMMKGSTLEAGAVGSLEGIATPLSVARRVMERTRHVMLVGVGAAEFARAQGFETRDMLTPEARRAFEVWRATGDPAFRRAPSPTNHDTVGAVGIDASGEAIAALSTSGLAWKMPGRVGDSPLVGAGGYADSDVGAVCATGVGEEVIRLAASHAIIERMRAGDDPTAAIERILRRMLRKRRDAIGDAQVAFIALRRDGALGHAALRPGFELTVVRGATFETLRPAPLTTRASP